MQSLVLFELSLFLTELRVDMHRNRRGVSSISAEGTAVHFWRSNLIANLILRFLRKPSIIYEGGEPFRKWMGGIDKKGHILI